MSSSTVNKSTEHLFRKRIPSWDEWAAGSVFGYIGFYGLIKDRKWNRTLINAIKWSGNGSQDIKADDSAVSGSFLKETMSCKSFGCHGQ